MKTNNIPFSSEKKKKITLNYLKSALWDFSKGLKNQFERAMVNEPSVFEPLKFYCILEPQTTRAIEQGLTYTPANAIA